MPVDTLEQCAALRDEQIDLARAALLIAREVCYPDLKPDEWLGHLDRLAAGLQPRCTGRAAAEQLNEIIHHLFFEVRFRGNAVDYYDPRNSYLNEVLAHRVGIPITLSLVFISVARRLGLEVFGVGLPGHFVAGVVLDGERVYIDPFNAGARLDVATMTALVQQAGGRAAAFDPAWLKPVRARAFLARMCGNLQNSYVMLQDWPKAMAATECLYLFARAPTVLRDLGYLAFQAGQLTYAADAFESYLIQAPNAEDADAIRENLASLFQKLARLN